jgi:hypothetical protein
MSSLRRLFLVGGGTALGGIIGVILGMIVGGYVGGGADSQPPTDSRVPFSRELDAFGRAMEQARRELAGAAIGGIIGAVAGAVGAARMTGNGHWQPNPRLPSPLASEGDVPDTTRGGVGRLKAREEEVAHLRARLAELEGTPSTLSSSDEQD